MLHPEKARLVRELKRLARPVGEFDPRRYFRGPVDLAFYNVGSPAIHALARAVYARHRDDWSVEEAAAFADAMIRERHLESKAVGIEVLARYRRDFAPRLLGRWKRWLAGGHAANWATTDTMCGRLIGPLLEDHPELVPRLAGWATHRNMWVRRASVVGLLRIVRREDGLDLVYRNAAALHGDREDLIQKAVGWALREAGKIDSPRLEQYLRARGPSIPRTTVRYAIERFPQARRRALLAATLR